MENSGKSKIAVWISAFRLRTLALSFALIIMGTALAIQHGQFDGVTFVLALVTTLFLQILSNLCNDYGDTVSGVDQMERKGPARTVQSGAITLSQMLRAMYVFGILSFLSGILLLIQCYSRLGSTGVISLLGIGILCIVAAVTYTVGRKPYGYIGLGDLSVFIFFGLVGVMGSNFLYSGSIEPTAWLMACSIGFLSMGVLNMNNLRDADSDAKSGKRTVVVMMGKRAACVYQTILIVAALVLLALYIFLFGHWAQAVCFLGAIGLLRHLVFVRKNYDNAEALDTQLKVVSISALLISLLFMCATVVCA